MPKHGVRMFRSGIHSVQTHNQPTCFLGPHCQEASHFCLQGTSHEDFFSSSSPVSVIYMYMGAGLTSLVWATYQSYPRRKLPCPVSSCQLPIAVQLGVGPWAQGLVGFHSQGLVGFHAQGLVGFHAQGLGLNLLPNNKAYVRLHSVVIL